MRILTILTILACIVVTTAAYTGRRLSKRSQWVDAEGRMLNLNNHPEYNELPVNGPRMRMDHQRIIAKKMGIITDETLPILSEQRPCEQTIYCKNLRAHGAFNLGKNEEELAYGTYIVMNAAMKLKMLPANIFGQADHDILKEKFVLPDLAEYKGSVAYGKCKTLAMGNDGAGLRTHIENLLGSPLSFDLTNDDLVEVWATNEHVNMHIIISPLIGNLIHTTSLSLLNGRPTMDGQKDTQTYGGFNNAGQWPQWGWLRDAQDKNLLTLIGA